MPSESSALAFVTVDGLLRYGEALAQPTLPRSGSVSLPTLSSAADCATRAHQAIEAVRAFGSRAVQGFAAAADYRLARQTLLNDACGGDPLVFFAAWNAAVAEGALAPLMQAPIGSVRKPSRRRPVAIVPRAQLTPQLAE